MAATVPGHIQSPFVPRGLGDLDLSAGPFHATLTGKSEEAFLARAGRFVDEHPIVTAVGVGFLLGFAAAKATER
jgi:hypothetical protein